MKKISHELPLKDFQPKTILVQSEHVPAKGRFPVIDAHNHLFVETEPDEMIKVMDETGVRVFVNTTGNTHFSFVESGYTYTHRDIGSFLDRYVSRYPDRFACFTMTDFARCQDGTLIKDRHFIEQAIAHLEEDIARGACGLKVMKELGLRYRDKTGTIIPIDDKRLAPIWDRAGSLGVPVLIHTSDPAAFFLPIDEYNEHYITLSRAPDWSFYGSHYSKKELLAQRDRMISRHPKMNFICPHVANYPEDLHYVSAFLESNPNAFIDIAARIDELGRQPYTAREFLIKYQDRVLFGTDMPLKPEIYRTYFRFLETKDEYFDYPDYVGVFGHSRWRIYGLDLPDEVLKKIYYKNACRIIPGIMI